LSKIYIFCDRHDENLLALYQECYFLGFECIAIYFQNIKNDDSLKLIIDTITISDYIIILHFPFPSGYLSWFISRFQYKKCLNSSAFKQINIGNKIYQQIQVQKKDNTVNIPTYLVENLSSDCIFPLIAKPQNGSCGQGVQLINNHQDIEKLPKHFIIQPYIPNDGDWRVVVIDKKPVSAIKRVGRIGQATNNIATGSFALQETNTTILTKIFYIATLAAEAMSFDYVGVDVIKNIYNDQYYFLETNERPTFETSQILTGVNIAKEIINILVKT